MSFDPKVEVTGEEDVLAALRKAGPRLRKAATTVVATAAMPWLPMTSTHTPDLVAPRSRTVPVSALVPVVAVSVASTTAGLVTGVDAAMPA